MIVDTPSLSLACCTMMQENAGLGLLDRNRKRARRFLTKTPAVQIASIEPLHEGQKQIRRSRISAHCQCAVVDDAQASHATVLARKYSDARGNGEQADDPKIEMSGWIFKKGAWPNPQYQKRWAVLRNGKLFYYASEEDAGADEKARGAIAVEGMLVQKDTGADRGPDGPLVCFTIMPDGQANRGPRYHRAIQCGVVSHEARSRWTDALSNAVAAASHARSQTVRSSFSLRDQPEWEFSFRVRPVEHGTNSGRPVILRTSNTAAMHEWIDEVERAVQAAHEEAHADERALDRWRAKARGVYHSEYMQYAVGVVILGSYLMSITSAQLLPPPGSAQHRDLYSMEVFFSVMFGLVCCACAAWSTLRA